MKVLIVEDDAASRLLLQQLLEPYGEVHTAINGQGALASFHLALGQDEPYDLVCLDITMPEMDGHTALLHMRSMEKEGSRAKIVMTTSHADRENVEKAIEEHCDAYIIKPLTRKALIDKLLSLGLL